MAKCGVWFGTTTPNTTENTPRYRIGLSIDQAMPSTEGLYLTLTSLRTRFHRIWRAPTTSRNRGTMWSRGGSDVRTTTFAVVVAMCFLWFLRGRRRALRRGEPAGERPYRRSVTSGAGPAR